MKIKTNVSGRFHWAKRIIVLFATLFLIMNCGDSSDDGGGTTGGTGGGGGVATDIDGVWKLASLKTCEDGGEIDVELPVDLSPNPATPAPADIYVKIEYGVVGFYAITVAEPKVMFYCDDVMIFNVEGTTITDAEQNGFSFVEEDNTVTISAVDNCETMVNGILEIGLEQAADSDIGIEVKFEQCDEMNDLL